MKKTLLIISILCACHSGKQDIVYRMPDTTDWLKHPIRVKFYMSGRAYDSMTCSYNICSLYSGDTIFRYHGGNFTYPPFDTVLRAEKDIIIGSRPDSLLKRWEAWAAKEGNNTHYKEWDTTCPKFIIAGQGNPHGFKSGGKFYNWNDPRSEYSKYLNRLTKDRDEEIKATQDWIKNCHNCEIVSLPDDSSTLIYKSGEWHNLKPMDCYSDYDNTGEPHIYVSDTNHIYKGGEWNYDPKDFDTTGMKFSTWTPMVTSATKCEPNIVIMKADDRGTLSRHTTVVKRRKNTYRPFEIHDRAVGIHYAGVYQDSSRIYHLTMNGSDKVLMDTSGNIFSPNMDTLYIVMHKDTAHRKEEPFPEGAIYSYTTRAIPPTRIKFANTWDGEIFIFGNDSFPIERLSGHTSGEYKPFSTETFKWHMIIGYGDEFQAIPFFPKLTPGDWLCIIKLNRETNEWTTEIVKEPK